MTYLDCSEYANAADNVRFDRHRGVVECILRVKRCAAKKVEQKTTALTILALRIGPCELYTRAYTSKKGGLFKGRG